MTKISCTRVGALAAILAASLGAAACDSAGCGEEKEEASTKAAEIVCGAGTKLQGSQCVATEPIKTQ